MSLAGDFSKYSTFVPKEHEPSLVRDLGKRPDFRWLIRAPHPEIDRLQGDLISNVPLSFLNDQGEAKIFPFTVLVLNNSCDLPDGRSEFVTTAPVVDFDKLVTFDREKRLKTGLMEPKKVEASSLEYARVLSHNLKTELLYLPPFAGFSNGAVALLNMATSIPAKLYQDRVKAGHRVGSFSQSGFYFLLIKVTHHFARAESEDITRI